jgi:hypothetical protein
MVVRQGTLFYANTPDAVLTLADTSHPHTPGDEHIIVLKGCSVRYCPEETDSAHHWAFKLTTPEVMLQSYSKNIKQHNADPPFAEAGTVVVHQRCSAQTGNHGDHQALLCAARCWGCDIASNTERCRCLSSLYYSADALHSPISRQFFDKLNPKPSPNHYNAPK